MTLHSGHDEGATLIVVLAVVTIGAAIVVSLLSGVDAAARVRGSNTGLLMQDTSAASGLDLAIGLLRTGDPTLICPVGAWSEPLAVPEVNDLAITAVCATDGAETVVMSSAASAKPSAPDRFAMARVAIGPPPDSTVTVIARQHGSGDVPAVP